MLLEVMVIVLAAASSLLAVTVSAQTFDHSVFDELLKKHVVKGMVDYDAIAQPGSFGEYLKSLERADPSQLSDRERLAFWINAYNARTIVLDQARGSLVDAKKAVVHASRTFDWFKDDFGGTEAAVGQYIAKYYSDSPEKQLLLSGRYKMEYLDYDWTLNSRYLARLRP